MRRIALTLAALTVASALAGCSGGGSNTSAAPSPSASPSPSPSPSPTMDPSQIQGWVDAAGIPVGSLGAGAQIHDQTGPIVFPLPCGNRLPSINVIYGHDWTVQGGTFRFVDFHVVGYGMADTADVVAQAQSMVQSCTTTYDNQTAQESDTIKVLGVYPLTALDHAFSYCEESTVVAPAVAKGHKTVFCYAVASRGPVVARVRVYGDRPTLAAAQQKLTAAVGLAVSAITAAVPAS